MFHILNEKITGAAWASSKIDPITPENIAKKIITTVNKSSSIWQQFGFIGHTVVLDETNKTCEYVYDTPVSYVQDNQHKFGSRYFVITLEYGNKFFEEADSVFNVKRVHKDDVDNAHLSPGLHPIIREYQAGELTSTFHLIEDFEANWADEERHVKPLIKYFRKILPDWATQNDEVRTYEEVHN